MTSSETCGKIDGRLVVGKKGELRLFRPDGSSARYGIRIGKDSIRFFDQLRGDWFSYPAGEVIVASDGRRLRINIEWL